VAKAQSRADSAQAEPLKRSPSHLASPTFMWPGASQSRRALGTGHGQSRWKNKIREQGSEEKPAARRQLCPATILRKRRSIAMQRARYQRSGVSRCEPTNPPAKSAREVYTRETTKVEKYTVKWRKPSPGHILRRKSPLNGHHRISLLQLSCGLEQANPGAH
jgi:hypothetical protein